MATFVLTGLSVWKASEAARLDLRQGLARQDNLLPFDVFTTGTLTLAEGQHISANDTHVAIISQDLTEKSTTAFPRSMSP